MFLYDQRSNMAQVNVRRERVEELLDTVYSRAEGLSVQKDQSRKLQQEMTDNYSSYREAIERAYTNAKERNQ